MADIDDFFKKRDKKKKTTQKAKFSTLDTEEFAKQLEATTTVTDGLGAESENVAESGGGVEVVSTAAAGVNHHPANHTGGAGAGENQDEEWKPFDSEDNKDYSGLRINQNWKLEDEEDLDEDGENDESEKKVAFSWGKKKQQQQEAPPQDDEEEKTDEAPQSSSSAATPAAVSAAPLSNDSKQPAETADSTETSATTTASSEPAPGAYVPPFLRKKMEEAKAAGAGAGAAASSSSSSITTATPAAASTSTSALPGAYVPPHLRNRGGGGDSGPSSSSSSSGASSGGALTGSVPTRRNRVQPNINDTLEFPTLATAIETETSEKSSTGNEESFVQSKKGARVEAKSNKPMIDLENKFMALETSNN